MSKALEVLMRPSVVAAIAAVVVLWILWVSLSRGRFWCLVLSCVVALALGEIACRALGLGAPERFIAEETPASAVDAPYPYEPNSELVYRYSSNPRGYFDSENRVVGHINSHGFRGGEPRQGASAGQIRICVLGDSFALGFGVFDEDTLPAQLERILREQGLDAEVLNFGVSATGTHEQVELLEDFVLTFEPDVVVFVLFLNDAQEVGTNAILWSPFAFARIREHCYFLNAVMNVIESAVRTPYMIDFYREGYEDGNPGWIRVTSSLSKARAMSEAEGFRLLVAAHPALFRLDGGYPFEGVHEKISDFCASQGIECVDLLDALAGESDEDMKVHRVDHHPNERAHGKSAELLARHILRSGAGRDTVDVSEGPPRPRGHVRTADCPRSYQDAL
ncbi:SGNH/GDSL hydrolase family protein [bacterium]|nr:SGNH/GDSL hydrolase family protein [bacterium]